MYQCPCCKSELDYIGFLFPIMDVLAKDKMNGQVPVLAPCCGKPLRAYSRIMEYWLEPADGSASPIRIGAA